MDKNTSIIRQAADHFKKGNFQQALSLYQQAAKLMGDQAVKANIYLCEKRLGQQPQPVKPTQKTPSVEEQLAQTQALLEDYYQRYQQLQLQVMEAR